MEIQGYCVKCKTKRTMPTGFTVVDVENKTGTRKTKAAKGNCEVCSTGMFKFLNKDERQALGV